MKVSAQWFEVREVMEASRDLPLVNLFSKNSHFLLNVNDSLGKNCLEYTVNDVARILPDHVN